MDTPRKTFPAALEPPHGDVAFLDAALAERALAASRRSPRGRVILPLHRSHAATLHRMLNAIQPGSYVAPHRHARPPKAEHMLVLRGALRFVRFDAAGAPLLVRDLAAASAPWGAAPFAVDVEPGAYHTILALAPDTLLLEAKDGPWDPASDKDFPAWAPREGDPGAPAYAARLLDLPET